MLKYLSGKNRTGIFLCICFLMLFTALFVAKPKTVMAAGSWLTQETEATTVETTEPVVIFDTEEADSNWLFEILLLIINGLLFVVDLIIQVIYDMLTFIFGASLSDIILGTARDGSISVTSFRLVKGNLFACIAAMAYSALRAVAIAMLTITFLISLIKALTQPSAKGNATLKSSLVAVIYGSVTLVLMPNLYDVLLNLVHYISVGTMNALGVKDLTVEMTLDQALKGDQTSLQTTLFYLLNILKTVGLGYLTLYLAAEYVFLAIEHLIAWTALPVVVCHKGSRLVEGVQTWVQMVLGVMLTPIVDIVTLSIPLSILKTIGGSATSLGAAMRMVVIFLIAAISFFKIRPRVRQWMQLQGTAAEDLTNHVQDFIKSKASKAREHKEGNREKEEDIAEDEKKAEQYEKRAQNERNTDTGTDTKTEAEVARDMGSASDMGSANSEGNTEQWKEKRNSDEAPSPAGQAQTEQTDIHAPTGEELSEEAKTTATAIATATVSAVSSSQGQNEEPENTKKKENQKAVTAETEEQADKETPDAQTTARNAAERLDLSEASYSDLENAQEVLKNQTNKKEKQQTENPSSEQTQEKAQVQEQTQEKAQAQEQIQENAQVQEQTQEKAEQKQQRQQEQQQDAVSELSTQEIAYMALDEAKKERTRSAMERELSGLSQDEYRELSGMMTDRKEELYAQDNALSEEQANEKSLLEAAKLDKACAQTPQEEQQAAESIGRSEEKLARIAEKRGEIADEIEQIATAEQKMDDGNYRADNMTQKNFFRERAKGAEQQAAAVDTLLRDCDNSIAHTKAKKQGLSSQFQMQIAAEKSQAQAYRAAANIVGISKEQKQEFLAQASLCDARASELSEGMQRVIAPMDEHIEQMQEKKASLQAAKTGYQQMARESTDKARLAENEEREIAKANGEVYYDSPAARAHAERRARRVLQSATLENLEDREVQSAMTNEQLAQAYRERANVKRAQLKAENGRYYAGLVARTGLGLFAENGYTLEAPLPENIGKRNTTQKGLVSNIIHGARRPEDVVISDVIQQRKKSYPWQPKQSARTQRERENRIQQERKTYTQAQQSALQNAEKLREQTDERMRTFNERFEKLAATYNAEKLRRQDSVYDKIKDNASHEDAFRSAFLNVGRLKESSNIPIDNRKRTTLLAKVQAPLGISQFEVSGDKVRYQGNNYDSVFDAVRENAELYRSFFDGNEEYKDAIREILSTNDCTFPFIRYCSDHKED